MIQAQVDHWKKRRKATRGELADSIREYLESNIPPEERRIQRGGETFDAVDYIIEDLDSYGT
jgi:hypothetical protein